MALKTGRFLIEDLYSIQLASRISGVGVHTIRAWEKRYGAVRPQRNDSGRRIYTESEVERLSMLSELCSLGHSIGHIANLPTDELKKNLKKLGRFEQRGGPAPLLSKTVVSNTDSALEGLILALKMYKLDIISHEFNKIGLVLSPRQLVFDIISPLLNEVGKTIAAGELSLSQEQALMALIRFHIGPVLFKQVQHRSKKPQTFVILSPEGELDDMPGLLSALLCAHYNLNFVYLGPNMPLSALMETVEAVSADKIILNVSPHISMDNRSLGIYIQKLLQRLTRPEQEVILRGHTSINVAKWSDNSQFIHAKGPIELDNYLKSF